MKQCSHQILWSGFTLAAFAICFTPESLRTRFIRQFLQANDKIAGVIRFVPALVAGARQYQRAGPRNLCARIALIVIQREQNWRPAFPAADAEIPFVAWADRLDIHGFLLPGFPKVYAALCLFFAVAGGICRCKARSAALRHNSERVSGDSPISRKCLILA
jgi:hypothetical protein